jgi:hypothetical protein
MTKIEPPFEAVHPFLERTGETPRAKQDLLTVLHAIMESFVDRAFGADPVQQATAYRQSKVASDGPVYPRRDRRQRSGKRRRSHMFPTPTTEARIKRRKRPCRTKKS